MTSELLELGRYGIIGVFLALIGLVVFVIRSFTKITENHIKHSHDVMEKNTDAINLLVQTCGQMKEVITNLQRTQERIEDHIERG